MGEGLMFATLTTMPGKRLRVLYGSKRVTIGAVGTRDGHRWVMATDAHGGVILGEPGDFTIPEPRKRKQPQREGK